ncbi:MAG: YfaZ family outer membrane protein, partial [Granulosicoccaceae bacterium]
ILTGAGVQAAGLELDLSEESGEFTYLVNSRGVVEGGIDLGLSFFYNNREDIMLSANILSLGQQAKYGQPLQLGVGAKIYGGKLEDDREIGAIGIGGRLGYIIPSQISPVAVVAEIYFAPSVTSFGEAERLMELTTRIEAEITPTAVGFFGYRLTTARMADTEDDTELDDNLNIGVRFLFAAPNFRR